MLNNCAEVNPDENNLMVINEENESETTVANTTTGDEIKDFETDLANLFEDLSISKQPQAGGTDRKWILLQEIGKNLNKDITGVIALSLHDTLYFWNMYHCSKNIIIDGNMITQGPDSKWSNVIGLRPGSYHVDVTDLAGNFIMIGLAPNTTEIDEENSEKCGYYIYTSDLSLWSKKDNRRKYGDGKAEIKTGTKISVILKDKNISYIVNGVDLGIAFSNVEEEGSKLYPSVDFYKTGCSLRGFL